MTGTQREISKRDYKRVAPSPKFSRPDAPPKWMGLPDFPENQGVRDILY